MVDRIKPVFFSKVAWCCAQDNVQISQLSAHVGISESRLTEQALSDDGLTFRQLRKIADYFNRGVLFFLEPGDVRPETVHSPQFRTLTGEEPQLSRKVKAIVERVEEHRDRLLSLWEELGVDARVSTPPAVSRSDIRGSANAVRQWLNVDAASKFDDYRTAVEGKGILVFRSNGYAGKWQVPRESPIAGFAIHHESCHSIFVRKLEPETRQTFTLMHELGHLLLHAASSIDREENLFSTKGLELEANRFAGYLLVPDERLEMVLSEPRPTDIADLYAWLINWKNAWGVSGEVILRRLLDAGHVSDSTYLAYREFSRSTASARTPPGRVVRSYRHREPNRIFGEKYVRTVLDALYAEKISLSKASSYLDGIKVADIQKLGAHLANV